MRKTVINKEYKFGFDLTEQEMRRVLDIILNQFSAKEIEHNIKIEIKYSNDIEEEIDSIEDVMSLDNSGSTKIKTLELQVSSVDLDNRAFVNLRFGPDFGESIKCRISGQDRDWVQITFSKIEDRIKRIRNFSWASIIKPIGNLLFYCFFCILIFIIVFASETLSTKSSFNLSHKEIIVAIISICLIAIGAVSFVLCFSPYNFCWGDQLEAIKRKKNIGYFILVVVIVGLILNVAASFIYSSLFT